VDRIKDFQRRLTEFLSTSKTGLLERIGARKTLDEALVSELKDAATQFKSLWS
jgi:F-type H+-transporting ATPase subunit alpha